MVAVRGFWNRRGDEAERGRQRCRPDEVAQTGDLPTANTKEAEVLEQGPAILPLADDDIPNWPKGWRPWTCLLACFFLMFNSWGLVNAYGTFGSFYLQHGLAPIDPVRVNLIGALQCFIVLGLSDILGCLLDAAYTRWVLGFGTVFVTVGMFSLGLAHLGTVGGQSTYGLTILTQGIITPLGMACFFVASSQIIQTWFKKQKTLAVGFVACGASIAGLVYPFTTKYLLESLPFKYVAMCDAAIVCSTSIFAWLFAVPKKPVTPRRPERWLTVKTWIDPDALHNPAWWSFTLGVAFLFLGFYAIFFNLEEWAAVKGFGVKDEIPGAFSNIIHPNHIETNASHDAVRTFYLLSIMNVCSSAGRIGGGWFGQRWGAVYVHWMVTAVAAILCLCMWPFITSVRGAIGFVVVFGMFSGAVIGMPPASIMWILHRDEKADDRRIGQWVGMMYTVAAIPALVGPVIAGLLIQRTGNYLTLHLWSGLCLAISAFWMALAHWRAMHDEEKLWLRTTVMGPVSALASRKTSSASSNGSANTKLSTESTKEPASESIQM